MELLPKNADSDVMKLQSDERDDDEEDSGDGADESDSEVEGEGGNGEDGEGGQRGEQAMDKVGAKRKKVGKSEGGKVTPSKKTKG